MNPQGKGETVLIVEDETAVLKFTKRILEKLDYVVLDATTPTSAIDLAQHHQGKIHLLLTDVIMPEMDGRNLAGRLQVLYPHLRVLFMSGYTADIITSQGVLDEGMNFIRKPFSSRGLAIKVRDELGKVPD